MDKYLENNFENLGLTSIPWVGSSYEKGGIFSNRILILGESHYGKNKGSEFHKDLTRLTILKRIGEADGDAKYYKSSFHTKIYKAFCKMPSTNENKKKFWHSVLFFNYIQGLVDLKPRKRPTKEEWNESFEPTLNTIRMLKPTVIVVLGYANWKNIKCQLSDNINFSFCKYKEEPINNNRGIYKLIIDSHESIIFCIKHPSAGFSSKIFSPLISKYVN